MQKLISNIEYLLLRHDCVIIPNYGGFVANRVGAKVSERYVMPSSRILLFNPLLTYNDGLLAQEYMRRDKISFAQAMSEIENAVSQIDLLIKEKGNACFGKLGMFSLDANGEVIFTYNKNADIDTCSYGAKNLLFAPIKQDAHFEVKKVVAVAAIFLLLLLPFNIIKSPKQSYDASFVPKFEQIQSLPKPVVDTLVQDSVSEFASTDIEVVQDSLISVENALAEEVSLVENVEKSQEKSIYHIIIASLPSLSKANQYLKEISVYDFENAQIVKADNRYRISVATFDSNAEAESFVTNFAANCQEFSEAWVFEESQD